MGIVFFISSNQQLNKSLNETTHGYRAQVELQFEQTKTSILHTQVVQDSCQKVKVLSQISLCFSQFSFTILNKCALITATNFKNQFPKQIKESNSRLLKQ